jgi:hypothetical protein
MGWSGQQALAVIGWLVEKDVTPSGRLSSVDESIEKQTSSWRSVSSTQQTRPGMAIAAGEWCQQALDMLQAGVAR